MIDNLIVLFLALIWISNTRYGTLLHDKIMNGIKMFNHVIKRMLRKVF